MDATNGLTKQQVADEKFFKQNLNTWLQDDTYKGKSVVISGEKIQAVFDHGRDAYYYAMKNFQPGEFIIQEEEAIIDIPSVYKIR